MEGVTFSIILVSRQTKKQARKTELLPRKQPQPFYPEICLTLSCCHKFILCGRQSYLGLLALSLGGFSAG